jgi:hypothetical protein
VEKIKDVGRKSLGIDKNFEPYPVSNGSHWHCFSTGRTWLDLGRIMETSKARTPVIPEVIY